MWKTKRSRKGKSRIKRNNTKYGKNAELKEQLKAAKLPVVEIEDLKRMAEELAGVPKPVKLGEKVVANVIYRDGTLLDVIHSVQ